MNAATIAKLAHTTADRLVVGLGSLLATADLGAIARTACGLDGISPDSSDGELYQARMVGHFINVSCGTTGL